MILEKIQRVYLSGLGAIGTSYADLLYRMDPDCLKIVANRERIQRYNQNGIFVNEKQVPFAFIQPGGEAPPADLIIIAVKQHQLAQAIEDVRSFVGEETIILSFLNGIVSEEMVGHEYGMEKLLYSFVVATDALRQGTHVYFTKVGTVYLGEKQNNTYSSKLKKVLELFDRAGIPYIVPEDMIYELWWKFCMNVGINQTSAVLRAPYRIFQVSREAREIMQMACREVIKISEQAGIGLTEESINRYFDVVQTLSPEGKTSMLQDVEAGRKTEVEIFAGTVVELGQKYGIPTPVNDLLLRAIKVIEQTYLDRE
jgi:2-dehydropantoate 2-reductase